ncbi:MAG: hypothetical protein WC310_01485 [Patescibacteria group bacterium]|jgi:hypothetical protein
MAECIECGLPLDEKNSCSCEPDRCYHCCQCEEDCSCGCKTK